ncbi:MAG: glycosyltransferase family 2 protein [Bacillota bacterium]|nr:glycosyltransferase family 2 protein [Bacillota bacterium]
MNASKVPFSVIIPAYNEARRIRRVIEVARRTPGAVEVIVVDDGSEDHTARVAQGSGARVLRLPENRGKGAAMLTGAQEARTELVLFLDADLLGLTPAHILALVEPVATGRADMTMGVFGAGRRTTDLAQKLAPFLSGQRAMYRQTFLAIPALAEARYGVEVVLSAYAREASLRVERVTLPGVSQVMKEEKHGFWRGFLARMKMYWEIVRSTWLYL